MQKQPPEAFYKKGIKISQNSQENICARVSFLMRLQDSDTYLPAKIYLGCSIFLFLPVWA